MSGRFSEGTREQLATATVDGLLSAADYAKLATLQVPVSRLVYAPATDHLSAAAISASTWTDIHANQNFTVVSTAAWFAVVIRLGMIGLAAGAPELAARALFDSAGSALAVQFAGGMVGTAGGGGSLSGGTFYLGPGTFAAAGTHTVKLQVYGNAAWTAYCRASSQPNIEFLAIHIVELSV